jgi:hypothetical protein
MEADDRRLDFLLGGYLLLSLYPKPLASMTHVQSIMTMKIYSSFDQTKVTRPFLR